ncbi:hypothetical protein [Paracoccus actinidiae]|uniref:hypothetical protein n=1 Tax=Paracoccus actinidiae TaxID=3064531 RepID=UPI0027D21508|nr:hypothetical protein [Paracoccus sp. M09]
MVGVLGAGQRQCREDRVMGWCPVDHFSIVELVEKCEIASNIIVREMQELADIFPANEDKSDDASIPTWDLQFVVHGKLIENFLHFNANKAVACSPSGQLFRISRVLMRPPIYNHWYSYEERFRRHPDLLYVDITVGLVDLHGVATRMDRWSEFIDGQRWQEEALSLFSHLDGWSVCFRADEVNISEDALVKL